MYRFRDELDNFWNAFGTLSPAHGPIDLFRATNHRSWPRVDLFVGDDRAVVRAAVPGLAPEDVSVEVEGDLVTLTCTLSHGEGEHEERTSRTRKLRLPFPVDAERAEASLARGVFELRLERLESDKPARITVKAG